MKSQGTTSCGDSECVSVCIKQLLVGLCSSLQVIFSACELGVFELLLKAQEPLSAQQVAGELSCSVDGMERLLDALVGIEILEVETTGGTGEGEERCQVRTQ